MRSVLFAALGAAAVIGCTQMASKPPAAAKVRDGELAVPADYKSWPRFLSEIQRPDAKQVREIYVNAKGHTAKDGEPFPYGTVFVMENWKAKEGADGQLLKGPDGKLVKGDLARVFVMGKGEGWGETAGEPKNGDWVYAAYDPSGKATTDPLATCRACHAPLTQKDFVHRYDEYFQKRAMAGK